MNLDNNWTHRTSIQRFQKLVAQEVPKTKHDHTHEAQLVQFVKEGSETAYMELINLYAHLISEVYRYPYQVPFQGKRNGKMVHVPAMNEYDKEDILQEILLHFYMLILECDSDRPLEGLLKGNLHFRFYHKFFDEFLEIDKSEEELDEFKALEHELSEIVDILLEDAEEKDIPAKHLELYQALNQLAPRQREVMEMSIVKGWNSVEIGEELDISPSTVRVTLVNSLKKLKTILKGS